MKTMTLILSLLIAVPTMAETMNDGTGMTYTGYTQEGKPCSIYMSFDSHTTEIQYEKNERNYKCTFENVTADVKYDVSKETAVLIRNTGEGKSCLGKALVKFNQDRVAYMAKLNIGNWILIGYDVTCKFVP